MELSVMVNYLANAVIYSSRVPFHIILFKEFTQTR